MKILLFLLSLSFGKYNFNESKLISIDDKNAIEISSFQKEADLVIGFYSENEYKFQLKCGSKETHYFKSIDIALKKIEIYDCAQKIHIYVSKFYDSIKGRNLDTNGMFFLTEEELQNDTLILEPNNTMHAIVKILNKSKLRYFLVENYTPLPMYEIILFGEY